MFAFGDKSKANLVGVHPLMARLFERVIETSAQDFMIFEGVRTIERQRKLVAAGASRTMDSMHIPAEDRLGTGAGVVSHAVDAVPVLDGQPRWEWGLIYPIAAAVVNAAFEQGVADRLTWGSYWGKTVAQWGRPGFTADDAKKAVVAYENYHAGPDFVDGPHWQIGRLF
jgi:peptidoglycan L-alanyl-D-glutamate endopeptidase CwlK